MATEPTAKQQLTTKTGIGAILWGLWILLYSLSDSVSWLSWLTYAVFGAGCASLTTWTGIAVSHRVEKIKNALKRNNSNEG